LLRAGVLVFGGVMLAAAALGALAGWFVLAGANEFSYMKI